MKKLEQYSQKRDFSKTPEPKPKIKKKHKKPIFVIQEHHASHLHYDFRIEIDGVLKSWAIPKGPSANPKVKRLAALTEDHPMDYATFEGIIPEGYGAGTVIVWDKGTYDNVTEKKDVIVPIDIAFDNGHIKLRLNGKKLKGEYALIKFKDRNWLFFKIEDDYAVDNYDINSEPQSVLSKKTIEKLDKKFTKLKSNKT